MNNLFLLKEKIFFKLFYLFFTVDLFAAGIIYFLFPLREL